jgi:hypothetical protein
MDDARLEAMDKEIDEELAAMEAEEPVEEKTETDEIVDDAVEEVEGENEELQNPDEEEEEEEVDLSDPSKKGKAFAKKRHELKAEKEAKEAALKESQELRERLARLEGKTDAIQTQQTQPTETSNPEPDKELDREEWYEWKIKEQDTRQAAQDKRLEQLDQIQKVSQERNGLEILEKQYAKKNDIADYSDRKEFIKEREAKLIKIQYPQATDAQVQQHIDNQELQMAADIYANGRNPAEVFSQMADAYGYTAESKTIEKKKGKKEPNLEKIERNQAKSANLMGGSGRGNIGKVSANELVSMTVNDMMKVSDEDFNKAMKGKSMIGLAEQ